MEFNVEVTSKAEADRLEQEHARQKMIMAVTRIEWRLADPDRHSGQRIEVRCEGLTQPQVEQIVAIYAKAGWTAAKISMTAAVGTGYVPGVRLI